LALATIRRITQLWGDERKHGVVQQECW